MPSIILRSTSPQVNLTPFTVLAVVYLAVLTTIINLAQGLIPNEPIVQYLPGVLLAPLALASVLPPKPKKSVGEVLGAGFGAAAGGGGTGAAIGAAGAGAVTGGMAAPAGALLGGIIGAVGGGTVGIWSALRGKQNCRHCEEKHTYSDYVCPNTEKYNLRPAELETPPDYWMPEDDATIYIGVNFDLTETDAKTIANRIFQYAEKDKNVRQAKIGGQTRILFGDFNELLGHKGWANHETRGLVEF